MSRRMRDRVGRATPIALALLSLAGGGITRPAAGQDADYPWELVDLAPGVVAAIQPTDARFNDSNSVLVTGADATLVVDAQTDAAAVRALLREIESRGATPVRYLVNTHWHGDHTRGNVVYREASGAALTILGHASLREDVPGRAAADVRERVEYYEAELPAARQRLADGFDREGNPFDEEGRRRAAAAIAQVEAWLSENRDARFLPPDLVYRQQALLEAGTPVELIHFRGHTRGDTAVYLPEHGILVAGDLVDAMPFIGHGYPAEWAAALRALLELDIRTVVPGHGPVLQGTDHMQTLLGYLEDLVFQVRESLNAGRSLEQTQAAVDLSRWRRLLATDDAAASFFDQVRDEAVARAWVEAGGTVEN